MLETAIDSAVHGVDLTREEARAAMQTIMQGDATPAQVAGYLVALRMKGETVDEIAGSAEAMRSAAVRVEVATDDLVDTAGTGGDGAGTINVSTTAALVAAGAGVHPRQKPRTSISYSPPLGPHAPAPAFLSCVRTGAGFASEPGRMMGEA